jgi:hypothetical protein
MIHVRKQVVALFVDKPSQQWVVRDSEGNFWLLPSVEKPWDHRQPFHLGEEVAGANPFDWMELIRRTPHGSVFTYQTMMRHRWALASLYIARGQHTCAGIEENLWGTRKGERLTTVQTSVGLPNFMLFPTRLPGPHS